MIMIKVLGIIIGLFMAYYTFVHYKRKEFGRQMYIMWTIVWALFVIFSIYPDFMDPLVNEFHFRSTMDLVTIFGLVFVLCISFFSYLSAVKNQNRLDRLVSEIAKQEAEKPKISKEGNI